MDIFHEIEGLSGENLGSALLRYLIFNSHEIRDTVLDLLSDNSPIGPISYSSHFSCRTEYPTTDDRENGYGDGRLDILIQLDDVVIGIENKFYANFQNGQPQKYLPSLDKVAESLKSINHSEVKVILFVLCPENRKSEAQGKIIGIKNARIITWEQILACLSSIKYTSNPVAEVIRSEFVSYLKRQFSFIHDFHRKAIHLRREFPEYGNALQREFVGRLWSLFPEPGGRSSNGKTWIGYYFLTDSSVDQKGWYGFVSNSEILDKTDNNAELIVVATYEPKLDKRFRKVKLKADSFIGAPKKEIAWVVDFSNDWNSIDVWRKFLQPFWEVIQEENT